MPPKSHPTTPSLPPPTLLPQKKAPRSRRGHSRPTQPAQPGRDLYRLFAPFIDPPPTARTGRSTSTSHSTATCQKPQMPDPAPALLIRLNLASHRPTCYNDLSDLHHPHLSPRFDFVAIPKHNIDPAKTASFWGVIRPGR